MPHKGKTVYKVDKFNNEILEVYLTISEAALVNNITYSDMKHDLLRKSLRRNVPYYFVLEENYDKNAKFTGKYNRPILVTDTILKRTWRVNSAEELAKTFRKAGKGCTSSFIHHAIRNGRKIYGRYKIEHAR